MNLTGSPSLLATFSPALRATAVGFVVVALVFCFLHLSRPDAQMWDESDNAIVIFDTLESENRWVLVRDGEPYFDKPPLWYYLTEVAVDLLGANELALRVVSAVAGFALLLLVFTTAARLFSPIAGLAAGLFMLAVSQLYEVRPGGVFATHHVRSADSDVLMIALAFAAFACFARASTGSRRGLLAGAAFTSLAVLAKGPLGLIPAIAFVAYVALTPARGRVRLRDAALAAGVFGVIFIPWHLGMYLAYGETFLDLYPRYVLYRATDGLAGHTPEPWYYLRVLTNRRIFFGIELVLVALVAVATDRARLARYSHAATLLASRRFKGRQALHDRVDNGVGVSGPRCVLGDAPLQQGPDGLPRHPKGKSVSGHIGSDGLGLLRGLCVPEGRRTLDGVEHVEDPCLSPLQLHPA